MRRALRWRNYLAIPLRSRVWRPGTDFKREVAKLVRGVASSGDYIVLSEKALAVSMGLLFDESSIKPDFLSKALTLLLMRLTWGWLLGELCKLSEGTLTLLRNYPIEDGARHKKLVLRVGGVLQALKPTSEAGVDATNVPKTMVCLPLPEPSKVAREVRDFLVDRLGVEVCVVVVDSDKCYVLKGSDLVLTCRSTPLPCSLNLGFISFLLARSLRKFFSPYATPIGFYPQVVDVRELLVVSELADRARGFGAGRNVFEVEEILGVKATDVSWSHLDSIPHYPVVVVKKLVRGPRRP